MLGHNPNKRPTFQEIVARSKSWCLIKGRFLQRHSKMTVKYKKDKKNRQLTRTAATATNQKGEVLRTHTRGKRGNHQTKLSVR